MNHRQLNLHTIIKQQQSKICQLKQQLGLVTQLSESRIIDTEKRLLDIITEKDQIIEMLKGEVDRERGRSFGEEMGREERQRGNRERQEVEREGKRHKEECERLRARVNELENRLQHTTQTYEHKLTTLTQQNKRLSLSLSHLHTSLQHTTTSITSLTKFYKTSIFQIPKRKQTLLWVDNLIKYMEVSGSNNEKKYGEVLGFVKGRMEEVVREVMKAVSEVVLMEEEIMRDGETVLGEVKQVVEGLMKNDKGFSQGLEEIVKIGKKQKDTSEQKELQFLKSQLQQLQTQSTQTTQTLKHRIKQLQSQRKALVLGFQQIKTYLQTKQSTYKQQITSLKHTINQLLQANDLRQQQFQQQIKQLSLQIESISARYYENIEFPMRRMNMKVEQELEGVRMELRRLGEESLFGEVLVGLEERVRGVDVGEEQKKELKEIGLCMKRGNQLLISIRQLVNEMTQRRSDRGSEQRKSQNKRSTSRKRGNSISGDGDRNVSFALINNNAHKNNKNNTNNAIQTTITTNKKPLTMTTSQQQQHPPQQPSSASKPSNSPLLRSSSQRPQPPHQQSDISFTESNIIASPLLFDTSQQEQPQQNYLQEQLLQLQSAVSLIQQKERENKYLYEISLLKKHNQKLTEHLSALEKRYKSLSSNKFTDNNAALTNSFMAQRKLIDLQSELDHAKEVNKEYEHLVKSELDTIMKRVDSCRKEAIKDRKEEGAINQALEQLVARFQVVEELLERRQERVEEVVSGVKVVCQMLLRPAETFERLVKEFVGFVGGEGKEQRMGKDWGWGGSNHWSTINPNTSIITHPQPSTYRSRLSINESTIKQYQQILTRRTQINNNGSRQIIQLIKTLRESFPVRDNKKRQEESRGKIKLGGIENGVNGANGTGGKSINFQKRVKQLVAIQQKHKQETSTKLDQILSHLHSLQSKRQKQTKQASPALKQKRIEQILQKHLTSILTQIQTTIDKSSHQNSTLNTQALRDLSSKLRESIRENEGLRKELEVVLMVGGRSGKGVEEAGRGDSGGNQREVGGCLGRDKKSENGTGSNFYSKDC